MLSTPFLESPFRRSKNACAILICGRGLVQKNHVEVFGRVSPGWLELFGRMNPGWRVTENKHFKTSSDSFFQKLLRDFLYQATICGGGRNLRPRPQIRITHTFFDLRNIDSRKGEIERKRPQIIHSPACAKAFAPYIPIGLSPSHLCT